MKTRIHGMLGTNHSWAFTQQAIARAISRMEGEQVFLKSTNGLEHFPDDLKPFLLPGFHAHPAISGRPYLDENHVLSPYPSQVETVGEMASSIGRDENGCDKKIDYDPIDKNRPYDLELAYTILYQIPRRFFRDSACRMVIWNFESSILPPGWHMYHRGVDFVLPSSQYSADIFLKNGIPSSKLAVVPHGVYCEMFNPEIPPFRLHTAKRVKFLHNAIPQHRKLHERVIGAYLDAFTGDDDVCLVLKTKLIQPSKDKPFEVDVRAILERLLKGRANPPEIEVVTSFVPDIGSLYTACDAVVSMSSCEGFWLPGLEALACGCVIIAPRHGGQLDFLDDSNALLVDTSEMKAPLSMQFWTYAKDAVVGDPNQRHCAELMRRVYENPAAEKARIAEPARRTVEKFTWEAAARQILDLAATRTAEKASPTATPTSSSLSSLPSEKKRVLYIVPYPMAGGGEVWVREAIRRLDRERYEPSIAFPLGLTPELEAMFSGLDVPMEDLRDRGDGNALKCLIEAGKPDIVHFYNSLQVYGLLLKTLQEGAWQGKVVETVHSELMWPDSMMKIAVRRGVSMLVGVSETICGKLVRMGNHNVRHLPQQVDWDRFAIPRSREVLAELGCPGDRFTVGTVARLSPEKNIPMVLACAKGMTDAQFVVVGDGPQSSILRGMASGMPNMVFAGRRTDVERFYSAFDALLLPSAMEGMPLTLLEALAAGTPVVASKVGAVPEIVSDGANGFTVSGSTRQYVEALDRLRDRETWSRMSGNARAFADILRMRGEALNMGILYDSLFV